MCPSDCVCVWEREIEREEQHQTFWQRMSVWRARTAACWLTTVWHNCRRTQTTGPGGEVERPGKVLQGSAGNAGCAVLQECSRVKMVSEDSSSRFVGGSRWETLWKLTPRAHSVRKTTPAPLTRAEQSRKGTRVKVFFALHFFHTPPHTSHAAVRAASIAWVVKVNVKQYHSFVGTGC